MEQEGVGRQSRLREGPGKTSKREVRQRMNYIVILFDDKMSWNAHYFLKSLWRSCPDCVLLCNTYGVEPPEVQKTWPGRVHFYQVTKEQYENRVATCRVEVLGNMPFKNGDRVVYLDVDIIVVGTHGRSAMYQLLMGGVSKGILKKSKYPVLVIPTHKRG